MWAEAFHKRGTCYRLQVCCKCAVQHVMTACNEDVHIVQPVHSDLCIFITTKLKIPDM